MSKEVLAAQREIIQAYYNWIVMQRPDIETIIEWLEDDLNYLLQKDGVEAVNDIIKNYNPHEVSEVKCLLCNHKWVAVRPKGCGRLECPNCDEMVEFENV